MNSQYFKDQIDETISHAKEWLRENDDGKEPTAKDLRLYIGAMNDHCYVAYAMMRLVETLEKKGIID